MKKKIAILGSTGSIGKFTLDVIRNNKNNFEIFLLTANNNYKQLIKQAKEFKVKNVIIRNKVFCCYIISNNNNTLNIFFSEQIICNQAASTKMPHSYIFTSISSN